MLQNKLFAWSLVTGILFTPLAGCSDLPKKENFKVPLTIADQSTSIKAHLAIAKDKPLWDNSHITVISYKNNLLLVGQTPSQALRERAEQIVSDIDNVSEIYNQLNISEPIAFGHRAKDTWLTTQVTTKLVTNSLIDSHKVKVVTEAGTVYLFGNLSLKQQDMAAKIASEVSGVQQVITVATNNS